VGIGYPRDLMLRDLETLPINISEIPEKINFSSSPPQSKVPI
jgi:hypothetical protein